jgi:hypothetical protein
MRLLTLPLAVISLLAATTMSLADDVKERVTLKCPVGIVAVAFLGDGKISEGWPNQPASLERRW